MATTQAAETKHTNPDSQPVAEMKTKILLPLCAALAAAAAVYGAAPPTITKIYDAPGQIWGGLAGDGSNLYCTTLAKNSGWTYSKVVSITATGSERWQWDNGCPLAGGNMRLVPTISPDGTRLLVGADHGKVFCLNTAMSGVNSYPQGVVWEYPPAGQPALSQPVRSEIAYDPVAPASGGGTVAAVYFQANDGYTYSLNATTGALRWGHNTGNLNGPPADAGKHPVPWSSAPVVSLDGTVYVGSANGYLYCLNPADGTRLWRVKLNASGLTTGGEPIEATPAIGENGWIYVGTRHVPGLPGGTSVAHLYAIDPTRPTGTPDDAAEKIAWTSFELSGKEPGTLAGIVVDWTCTVYVTDFFSDQLFAFEGATGVLKFQVSVGGKPCQAPAINRNGMLYLGTSTDNEPGGSRGIRARKVSPTRDSTLDWSTDQWTAGPGAPGVFGDFYGGVLVRTDASGTAYLADANPDTDTGAVYKFTSGSPSMAGDWPTLGCGNRRQHKARTYPYTMVELTAFFQGDASAQAAFSVDAQGRPVGYAHGNPGYPLCSMPVEWYGAYWTTSGSAKVLGNQCSTPHRDWARAGNLAGVVVGYRYAGPIVWPNAFGGGSAQLLPLPVGLSGGEARDINADSSIIGFSNSGSNPQVVRWDFNGSSWDWTWIGDPGGGKAYAYALSNQKRICGKALFTVGGQWQGYTTPIFANDFFGTVPLGTFGGAQSEAWEVHDVGGTAGWAHKRIASTDYQRAFRVPPDFFTLDPADELPGFAGQSPTGAWRSYGYGINGCGQVVGSAQNTSGAYRAFLYQPGATVLTDLTALAPSGWVLTSAVGISDAGHIVGSGTKNGASRQWLIYPQPQE
jgi:probable HAF family extracellular repeat protein